MYLRRICDMAFNTYNNNDKKQMTAVYGQAVMANSESKICASRFSISYLNGLMKLSIALKNSDNSQGYATYDNSNAVTVFLPHTKAKMLNDMITFMRKDKSVHNVCMELRGGLFKVSDGTEFGSSAPCFSIMYARDDGETGEVIYETKNDFHTAAYNYENNKFSSKTFTDIELDMLQVYFSEYVKASGYAIAATVADNLAYKLSAQYDLIRSIAEKVGARSNSKQNNKPFLDPNGNRGESNKTPDDFMNPPKEYEMSSFDDIANSMD